MTGIRNWKSLLLILMKNPVTVLRINISNHLVNLAIRTSQKKYNYNIGVDFEPQKSVSHSLLSDAPEDQLERSVMNFSPTVNFRYKFSKRTRLQIVYRGKGKQPNIRDLQPVTDRTNPLNIRVGNPSLKPAYTNTFTLNFNSYNTKHQRNMVATALFENTINNVTNQVTYDSETGCTNYISGQYELVIGAHGFFFS